MFPQRSLKNQKIYIAIAIVIISLLSIFAYSNTFSGEFQFDDDTSVIENPYVNDISKFLRLNPKSILGGVRPVTTFTFALNYWFGGADVRWYHITNFIIHILNGALVFYLMLLTMRSPKLPASYPDRALPVALISSAIFLLHPIQTESVSYISQRYESLASLFYLCSLIAYIKARFTPSLTLPPRGGGMGGGATAVPYTTHAARYTLYAISIICAVLALGSKEIAITLPVIILLYDFYFLEDRPFFKRVAGPGVFIVLALISSISILFRISKGIDVGFSVKAFTPWEYLMTQFRALTTYIRLLFLPINQNLDYDFRVSKSLFEAGTALSFIFLLALLTFALLLFKKWRVGSFFILWFFIILAPTSSIIPIIDPIFEHRVYLASAGIFVIIADILSRWISMHPSPSPSPARGEGTIQQLKAIYQENYPSPIPLPQGEGARGRKSLYNSPPLVGGVRGGGLKSLNFGLSEKYNKIAVCTVIILIVLLSGATFQRNKVWDTKLSLWEDAAKKSPMKSRVHNNLGNCYMLLDRHFEAIEEYKKAVALDKNNIEAYYNLGINLDNVGLLNQAVYYYDIFYKIAPAQYDKQKEIVRERIDSFNSKKSKKGK